MARGRAARDTAAAAIATGKRAQHQRVASAALRIALRRRILAPARDPRQHRTSCLHSWYTCWFVHISYANM
jgi:hypothetical protein